METEVPEVVRTLTLIIIRSRIGEPRLSVTLGSLCPLIFLTLLAILGIEFPWSLHLAFGKGFQPYFQASRRS